MVMLQELGGVLHPLMGMELWGSKIYFSMSQACGDGCNEGEGEGATWLSWLHVRHVGSFMQLSKCQKSKELGNLWFLGSILKTTAPGSACPVHGVLRTLCCALALALLF